MKESPFAALSLKEQQEKWIAWQSQHLEEKPLRQPVEASLPPVELPHPPRKEEAPKEKAASPPPFPPPRHRQYDAVLKRMNEASRKATAWHSVT